MVERLNEQRDDLRQRRETFLQNNNIYAEVVFLTEAMIELEYYRVLANAALQRARLNEETIDNNLLISKLNDAADRFFHSGIYSNAHFVFIGTYISAAIFATEPPNSLEHFASLIKDIAVNDVIKDFMLAVEAGHTLLQNDLESFRIFASHINHNYLLDRVMHEYQATRMRMLYPELISSHILRYDNFLTNIVASAIGNVHVINIAASWCAPCKPVLTDLAQMMIEYADSDVSFSFISITDDEESRIMYEERGIPLSLAHFANREEELFLTRTFSPFGLPLGILVNRNGVIVDFGRHVRPEMGLEENIELLLRQDNLVR